MIFRSYVSLPEDSNPPAILALLRLLFFDFPEIHQNCSEDLFEEYVNGLVVWNMNFIVPYIGNNNPN